MTSANVPYVSLALVTARSTYQPPAACSASEPTAASAAPGSSLRMRSGPWGEKAEEAEEGHQIDRERGAGRTELLRGSTDPASDREACRDRRSDERPAEDSQHHESAHPRRERAALLEPGNVPDLVERPAERERDAQTRPERPSEPDHERSRAPGQRLDLVLELRTDDRDAGERRVQHVLLERRVVLENEAEYGHQHQQQREQREEGVVGDERREIGGAVVEELAHHRHRKRDGAVPPLPAVEGSEHSNGFGVNRGCVGAGGWGLVLLRVVVLRRGVGVWSRGVGAWAA